MEHMYHLPVKYILIYLHEAHSILNLVFTEHQNSHIWHAGFFLKEVFALEYEDRNLKSDIGWWWKYPIFL